MVAIRFLLLSLFIWYSFCCAGIKLELDDVHTVKGVALVAPGQHFTLKIISDKDNLDDVIIDGIRQLDNLGSGYSSHSVLVNGSFSSTHTKTITLSCAKEGEFTIGPAHIARSGDVSNSVTLKIDNKADALNGDDNQPVMKVAAQLGTGSVVVGQPVTLTVQIMSAGAGSRFSLQSVEKDGFTIHEISQGTQTLQEVDGRQMRIIQKQFVLIPDTPGDYSFDPIRVGYTIPAKKQRSHSMFGHMMFASMFAPREQQRIAQSNGLTLHVEQLPAKAHGVHGVGDFKTFNAVAHATQGFVNEPITITLELTGRGNLDQVVAPKLNVPKGTKYYDSKSSVRHNFTKSFGVGSKTFEYVVQCGKAGTRTIPSQTFVFYDPKDKKVKKLKSESIELSIVQPAGESVATATPQVNGPTTGEPELPVERAIDIAYIDEEFTVAREQRHLPWWLFILILFIVLAAFLTRHTKKILGPFLFSLPFRFGKKVLNYQQRYESLSEQGDIQGLYSLFLDVIGTKLQKPKAHITQTVIEHFLQQRGWPDERVRAFVDFLDSCMHHTFGQGVMSKSEQEKLFSKAEYWLTYLQTDTVPYDRTKGAE